MKNEVLRWQHFLREMQRNADNGKNLSHGDAVSMNCAEQKWEGEAERSDLFRVAALCVRHDEWETDVSGRSDLFRRAVQEL